MSQTVKPGRLIEQMEGVRVYDQKDVVLIDGKWYPVNHLKADKYFPPTPMNEFTTSSKEFQEREKVKELTEEDLVELRKELDKDIEQRKKLFFGDWEITQKKHFPEDQPKTGIRTENIT